MSGVNKIILIVALIVFIGVVSYVMYNNFRSTTPNSEYQSLIEKMDSLNIELDILKLQRDSLRNVIDSSKVKVEVIEHWYEKKLTDITNQPIAADVEFFTNYISKANE